MYSKFNIESKVNCCQWGSLLSGATGSLGMGGAGGGSGAVGTQAAAPSATSGDITSGDITPSISGIYGGGFNVTPTLNIAFPKAKLNNEDDVNPALELFSGGNLLYVAIGGFALIMFFFIFGRR